MFVQTAEKVLKWVELGSSLGLAVLVGLVLLSGFGTVASTGVSDPVVTSQQGKAVVHVSYHALNPGPLPVSPVTISLQVVVSNGTALSNVALQQVSVSGLSSVEGNLSFVLDLSAAPSSLIDSLKSGSESPSLRVEVRAEVWGLAGMQNVMEVQLSGVF